MTTLLRAAWLTPTVTTRRRRLQLDAPLVGVLLAMVLWALLHLTLAVSWLSAGKV